MNGATPRLDWRAELDLTEGLYQDRFSEGTQPWGQANGLHMVATVARIVQNVSLLDNFRQPTCCFDAVKRALMVHLDILGRRLSNTLPERRDVDD
ncbi:hypothetical protein KFL_003410150 [Klebsormidium nitens]|uniref:Uncharacterized protein n=1 Tax=Klebsormidium nitens TaxID=105231 RepID=A0A1Y1IGJ1_KLENI|nr:hypothetical protein KFL_003410150 [Klebsormidium nitens]|eukprot:GAQ87258.1 hypothetical protein KFL_003410150 [Klebsormidium nitens]